MIRILSRLFIKDRDRTDDPAVRHAYGVLAGAVGIVLNLALFAAKYMAGAISGSIAITADAFNNLSDAGSSIITLLGFKLAGQKPDSDHPYGHGHYEYIAGLIVSLAILMVGFDLAKTSIGGILHPSELHFNPLSMVILGLSILVKLYMAAYNRAVGKKIHSVALSAAAADSLSDVFATSVVLISTLIARLTGVNIDPWAGAAVSLMILWAGFNAAKDTISPLLGKAPDPEFVARIHDIVGEYPDVVGVHDLMVHDYGAGQVMISLHAEVSASGDIMALHEVVDDIERRLQTELNCTAIIHMDPICAEDEQVACARSRVEARIHETLGAEITIHDFRMVRGNTHTKILFDALVPYHFSIPDRELKNKLIELAEDGDENCSAVVTIDHPFA